MSILSVFLQRKEGCAVEDCTALGFCFSCSFLRSGSLFILFAGPPPCTRRPLLKKGSIRKLFLRTDTIFLIERHRIRNAGTVDFGKPIYGHRSLSHGNRVSHRDFASDDLLSGGEQRLYDCAHEFLGLFRSKTHIVVAVQDGAQVLHRDAKGRIGADALQKVIF